MASRRPDLGVKRGIRRTCSLAQKCIQGCNVVLVIVGMAAAGLAGSQFSDLKLNNYRNIDLRLLNWIHALTGATGVWSVTRVRGIAVAKVLYGVSTAIGCATAIFYGFGTFRIVDDHNSRDGFSPLEFADGQAGGSDENYAARVVISAVMIGIGFLAAMIALIATLLVDQMLILSDPAYPLQSSGDQMHAEQRSNATLVSIGLMKLFLGLGVLGLSAFVEYEHEKESNDICPKCIKIALEHISAMLAVTSSATDILSSRRGRARQTELLHKVKENALEFHVALGAAVVAAVWCLKTVDHNMVPFYKNDLKYFYRDKDLTGLLSSSSRYITVIAHGVLIGCFGVLFFLCALSSAVVGFNLQADFVWFNPTDSDGSSSAYRCLSLLHMLWGASLMALCVLGLLNLSWRGEFLGGDLLWLVVLFVSTAILGSSNQRSTLTAQLVMNIVCVGIAAEKLCASINAIYQFSTYPVFVHGADDVYDAQIVLISVQTGVLAAEVLTALCCCVLLGKQLSLQRSYFETQSPTCLAIAFSISTLFYGVVMTGCYVVFELGKWRYNEVPLEIAFFRIANGPLALAAFIVQILCCCCPWLLVVSVILQTIVGSLALFTISLSTTNVYYMQALLLSTNNSTPAQQSTIYDVALILSAAATLACVTATLGATLYNLCSRLTPRTVLLLENSPQLEVVRSGVNPSLLAVNSHSPVPGQLMEEQTVYVATDENPFYYHTSKRFYRQPYKIESGFYGYALANHTTPEQRTFASSGSQTQIAHVFAVNNRL